MSCLTNRENLTRSISLYNLPPRKKIPSNHSKFQQNSQQTRPGNAIKSPTSKPQKSSSRNPKCRHKLDPEKDTPRFSEISSTSFESRELASNIGQDPNYKNLSIDDPRKNVIEDQASPKKVSRGRSSGITNDTKDNSSITKIFGKMWENNENFENFNDILNITFSCDSRGVNKPDADA